MKEPSQTILTYIIEPKQEKVDIINKGNVTSFMVFKGVVTMFLLLKRMTGFSSEKIVDDILSYEKIGTIRKFLKEFIN